MNSFGNGIMMTGDMPMLSGTWYNPKTGDNFTVRDCYLEGNGIKVMTTDGRMLDYNIIQNYVQSDKPIPKQPKVDTPKKSINKPATPKVNAAEGLKESVPEDINSMLTPEDQALLGFTSSDLLEDPLTKPIVPQQKATPKVVLKNADIIAKGLKKAEIPIIDVKLHWTTFPEKELNALTEIMDIPVEDIVSWMTEEYFKFDDLKKSISEYIKNVIENGYNKDIFKAPSAVKICEEPKESENPKKTTKNTSKKSAKKK